jgi:hypothetical protein
MDPRPRILILCEGKLTEPTYFSHWRDLLRNSLLDITIDRRSGVPKTLVERAAERKRAAGSEARRRRDDNLLYDEIWCVFDVDEHPRLDEARVQAHDNDIRVAISNPCFELWLILHFRSQKAYLTRHAAKDMAGSLLTGYDKELTAAMFELLEGGYQDAVARCRELRMMHESGGSRPDANPSSGVCDLTERLRESDRAWRTRKSDG